MHMPWNLSAALQERRDAGLWRQRHANAANAGPRLLIDGRHLTGFCSNDYLGLASEPRVIDAACRAAREYGAGSGASAQVCGYHRLQQELEAALADFLGREACLVFSSGFMTNCGVLDALLGRGDEVFMDRLNHASLLDGARLSGARLRRYPHADASSLQQRLQDAAGCRGRKLVVTDGVFSMDGDLAPLQAIRRTCDRHDARLMLDDAHGFGVLGARGTGTLEQLALDPQAADIHVATLGKAVGASGGFVAGSAELIDYLQQFARTAIYSTALPPMVSAAALAGLEILRTEPQHRQRLRQRIEQFRRGARELALPLLPSDTAIQPLMLGATQEATALSDALRENGLLVTAMRPPTVAEGTARLRITLSALHSESQVNQLLETLASWPFERAEGVPA